MKTRDLASENLIQAAPAPDEHPQQCDRNERLTLGEALHLREFQVQLTPDEARQIVSARRLAKLNPERPVWLRTCAFVLLSRPGYVRHLLDYSRLDGQFVGGHWEIQYEDLRELVIARWRETHAQSAQRRAALKAAEVSR